MSKTPTLLFFAALSILTLSEFVSAQDASDLKAKELVTTLCSACHGTNGISPADTFPNLRGLGASYIEKQLKDFRDKTRIDASMNANASTLDDDTIKALANYYSNLAHTAQ